MKYRNGFVNNSSSSSFVLVNSGESPVVVITIKLEDIVDLKIVKTKEELNRYYNDEWCSTTLENLLNENEYYKEEYSKYLAAINEGKTLYFGAVCNDSGNDTEALIKDRGFPKEGNNFEILEFD